MFNALFILIVFLLQLNKDSLYVEWPFGVKTNITFNEETNEVIRVIVFSLLFSGNADNFSVVGHYQKGISTSGTDRSYFRHFLRIDHRYPVRWYAFPSLRHSGTHPGFDRTSLLFT